MSLPRRHNDHLVEPLFAGLQAAGPRPATRGTQAARWLALIAGVCAGLAYAFW